MNSIDSADATAAARLEAPPSIGSLHELQLVLNAHRHRRRVRREWGTGEAAEQRRRRRERTREKSKWKRDGTAQSYARGDAITTETSDAGTHCTLSLSMGTFMNYKMIVAMMFAGGWMIVGLANRTKTGSGQFSSLRFQFIHRFSFRSPPLCIDTVISCTECATVGVLAPLVRSRRSAARGGESRRVTRRALAPIARSAHLNATMANVSRETIAVTTLRGCT